MLPENPSTVQLFENAPIHKPNEALQRHGNRLQKNIYCYDVDAGQGWLRCEPREEEGEAARLKAGCSSSGSSLLERR